MLTCYRHVNTGGAHVCASGGLIRQPVRDLIAQCESSAFVTLAVETTELGDATRRNGGRSFAGFVGSGRHNGFMDSPAPVPSETALLRKARGAFFTPDSIARFVARWAVRDASDSVLEPSAGEAAFLVEAVHRLRELAPTPSVLPRVEGVEIHAASAESGATRVAAAGGLAQIKVSDFFQVQPRPEYSVVIGNPPFIRYQDFTGESRARSRQAALRAGVNLTALASSWAAFTVHSALFLRRGGRMGLVLPAELLSVNYAGAVRQFLFRQFRSVELVLFSGQVFPEAQADVVLLLADGYQEGPTDHAIVYQAEDAAALATIRQPVKWTPTDPGAKWTGLLLASDATEPLRAVTAEEHFSALESWGDTTLGAVTGNNNYFALSPARVAALGLPRRELLRLSPPGSSHLRGLELSAAAINSLGRQGRATWLFRPTGTLSKAAADYVEVGRRAGVNDAYKCRVRKVWYCVPVVPPADLMLTCMNADVPRLTTNNAAAHHLNSVHGVYLREEVRALGRDLLPLASLNSITLLDAEMVGRSYGGGVLKIEPREADVWAMPSPGHVEECASGLRRVRERVRELLAQGNLAEAVDIVDRVILVEPGLVTTSDLNAARGARLAMMGRRVARSKHGR